MGNTMTRRFIMKKIDLKKALILSLIILFSSTGILFSQSHDKYFDSTGFRPQKIHLTVFCPSVGHLRSLWKLQEEDHISLDNLIVVGVYHHKERTDYRRSKKFIKENQFAWVRFHELSGDLNKNNLFTQNPLSQEFKKLFQKSDGIIFFGGADIPPYLYGENTNFLTSIRTPYRHFLELSFAFHLLGGSQDESFPPFADSAPSIPVLGLCLGAQTLNVGTGGTMVQDIWSEIYGKTHLEEVIHMPRTNWHFNPYDPLFPQENLLHYNSHPISLQKTGKFCAQMKFKESDQPYIISSHHQAIEKLGKGLKISATSLDGKVVEAVEHKKYPHLLGTQFHPEFTILWDKTGKFRIAPEDEEGINLNSFLKSHPPSFEFHKKIWSWFSKALSDFHEKNR